MPPKGKHTISKGKILFHMVMQQPVFFVSVPLWMVVSYISVTQYYSVPQACWVSPLRLRVRKSVVLSAADLYHVPEKGTHAILFQQQLHV